MNNLLHLVIVKYGVISLVLCISTHLRLVTILSLLMKYLVIFHADPCNKSYVCTTYTRWEYIEILGGGGTSPLFVLGTQDVFKSALHM